MPITEDASDYAYIIDLIYERSGIRLHEGKKPLIRARLGKRMRALGIEDLGTYCDHLRSREGENELTHTVDALTTNFTSFLREEQHFKTLVNEALPSVIKPGQKAFKVWSAACSTGEEPYSIAIYLAEHFPLAQGWNWEVLATDISTKALDKAKAGVYASDRLNTLPPEWLRRHFQRGEKQWAGYYRVKPALAARIKFMQLNLLGDYPFSGPFETIFCRNVMIYFDRPTQHGLVNHLHSCLGPGGWLMVGHSESLTGLSTPLKCIRPSIYRRTN
ncbi:MAG TPA: protein-glutamate O-methyltransferase CheR [Verrucomicrobiae bacterium]